MCSLQEHSARSFREEMARQAAVRVQIPQPTGELLPAEERLQKVLKAIEARALTEQRSLHVCQDLYELGSDDVTLEDVERQRGFVSGLDIAWSLAQTEALRRTDSPA
jgi:hypothetical protein